MAKNESGSSSRHASDTAGADLDLNQWQIVGIKKAIASIDQGRHIVHADVRAWVGSWDGANELPNPDDSTNP